MTVSCYGQLHVSAQDGCHQDLYKNMKSKIGLLQIFFVNMWNLLLSFPKDSVC